MKIMYIVLLSVLAIVVIIQLYITMSTARTETQPYTVVKTFKTFEIRHYPSANIATIHSAAKSYKELGNGGFGKLANYIFGGNDKKEQISMTAPVHMDINDSQSTMSFVMPEIYKSKSLPNPNNSSISISKTKDEYVAAIRFGGFSSDKKIKEQTAILVKALQTEHLNQVGNFRFLGYNPPYQLFGRRNEVIVEVDWQIP